jgi:hypothetical protein
MIITVTNPKDIPEHTRGPYTVDEFVHTTLIGNAYCLHHKTPKPYDEYFIVTSELEERHEDDE